MKIRTLIFGTLFLSVTAVTLGFLFVNPSTTPNLASAPGINLSGNRNNDVSRRSLSTHRTQSDAQGFFAPRYESIATAHGIERTSAVPEGLSTDESYDQDRPQLPSGLHNADSSTRIAAMQQLYPLDEQVALGILAPILSQDDDPDVRAEAVRVTANIGGEGSVMVLMTALDDKDPGIQLLALELIDYVSEKGVSLLGQTLLSDPSPELRLQALRLLAEHENPAAINLIRLAIDDEDEEVRQHAIAIVGAESGAATNVGSGTGTSVSLSYQDASDLLADIATSDEAGALFVLDDVIEKAENPSSKIEAIDALTGFTGKQVQAMLQKAAADPDANVRYRALTVIADRSDDPVPILSQFLFADPDPELRRRAVEMLGTFDDPAVSAVLQAALQRGDSAVIEPVQALLESRPFDPDAHLLASDSLHYLDGIGQSIRQGLNNTDFYEPLYKVQDAHGLDDHEMSTRLADIIRQDEDPYVRSGAISVLATIGGEDATHAIANALGDDDVVIRHQAIETLWYDVEEPRIHYLGQVLFGDPDPELRAEAIRFLADDGGDAAMALLQAAINDPDKDVSLMARQAVDPFDPTLP